MKCIGKMVGSITTTTNNNNNDGDDDDNDDDDNDDENFFSALSQATSQGITHTKCTARKT